MSVDVDVDVDVDAEADADMDVGKVGVRALGGKMIGVNIRVGVGSVGV